MLWRQLRSSLIAKATLVIGVLFIIALVRVLFVSGMSWLGRHDDAAIVTVSTLRSSIYRLSLGVADEVPLAGQVQAAAISGLLRDERLVQALQRPGREPLLGMLQNLQGQWERRLRPALEQGNERRFLSEAEAFVRALDRLANDLQLEQVRLQSIDLLQVIITMLIVISLQLLAIYALRRKVAVPLRELLDATGKLRDGNLDVRVGYQAGDEIGQLALSFNTMADALAASHRELAERVDRKRRQLEQANAALELLFRSGHRLAQQPLEQTELDELLQRFQELLPGLQLTLLQPGADVLPAAPPAGAQELSLLVRNQGQVLGELRARFSGAGMPGPWETELVQALADLIGAALLLGRQREQDNRLLLHNERNVIARELHDSLAQSLSFMKLQIARLQTLILQGEDGHAVAAVAEELREGINGAYGQLRELLTTFRLDIGEAELETVLQDAAREFSRRSDVQLELQTEHLPLLLTPLERTQLVQILREALANCARHAQASHVLVSLHSESGEVELVVEDDGQGLGPVDPRQHHGLAIMQERALSIGGTLLLETRQPRGTRVRLRFHPGRLAQISRGATP